jgi:DNA-binding NarL/FixJ family response regulator
MLIEAQPDMEVVGEAGEGRAALEALAVTHADLV